MIIDRSLTDERGHHYALTHVITRGALEFGAQVTWYTNKSFSSALHASAVEIRPIFSGSIYDSFRQPAISPPGLVAARPRLYQWPQWILSRVRNSVRYRWAVYRGKVPDILGNNDSAKLSEPGLADVLESHLDAEGLGERDQILVHTADGDIYRAFLELVLRGKINDASPRVHLVTPFDPELMPHYNRGLSVDRVVEFLRTMGVLGRHIFLYGENEALADFLSRAWDVTVGTLPIPPPPEAAIRRERDPAVLTVAYLGAAREEKGFLHLPEIIERCRQYASTGTTLRFVIQCSPQIVGYTKNIRATIEKLREFSSDDLTLIETEQSMADYYGLLHQADVILACYDAEKYRVRGSGIAVETLAFGKTLIATPETVPARIAGSAAVCASTAEEIADSITDISRNFGRYEIAAAKKSREYNRQYSGTKYVAKIFAVGENSSPNEGRARAVEEREAGSVQTGTAENWEDQLAGLCTGSTCDPPSYPLRALIARPEEPADER